MSRAVNVLLCLIFLLISSCVIVPYVEAEIFNIGEKVSESDLERGWPRMKWYYFDSGCTVGTQPEYANFTKLIFDGNLSTGIDHDFGDISIIGDITYYVLFPYPTYVNNFTFHPRFNGNATQYSFGIDVSGSHTSEFFNIENVSKTVQINGFIKGFQVRLYNLTNVTEQINFNDVIVNYTRMPTDLDSIIGSMDEINLRISDLEFKINKLNMSDNPVWENITNIWIEYNYLNNSMVNILNMLQVLNNTLYENITQINYNITQIEKEINEIKSNTSNCSKYQELQDLIDKMSLDIKYLNENITDIRDSMPNEYNDTALKDRISKLEYENDLLNDRIDNLTAKLGNLTKSVELNNSDLYDKIDNLTKQINDLKGSKTGNKSEEQNFDSILLLIILVVMVILIITYLYQIYSNDRAKVEESITEFDVLKQVMLDISRGDGADGQYPSNHDLRQRLDEKYQRGEISRSTYELSLNNLQNSEGEINYPQNENMTSAGQRKS